MAERYRIVVEFPRSAGDDVIDAMFTAVSDAAFDTEPKDRDGWDVDVYGTTVDDRDD